MLRERVWIIGVRRIRFLEKYALGNLEKGNLFDFGPEELLFPENRSLEFERFLPLVFRSIVFPNGLTGSSIPVSERVRRGSIP